MSVLKNKKDELFKGVLESVDRDLKLSTPQEAKLVAYTYDRTFELLSRLYESELRNNYIKKSKPRINKTKNSRLQSIK